MEHMECIIHPYHLSNSITFSRSYNNTCGSSIGCCGHTFIDVCMKIWNRYFMNFDFDNMYVWCCKKTFAIYLKPLMLFFNLLLLFFVIRIMDIYLGPIHVWRYLSEGEIYIILKIFTRTKKKYIFIKY